MTAPAPRLTLAPSESLRLLDSDREVFSLFLWKNITIVAWPSHATGPSVQRVAQATRRVASEFPQGFSNVHLVKQGAGLPDAEARAGFAEMMNRHARELACIAVVLLGSGFWASALQSAVTGIRMMSRQSRRAVAFRVDSSLEVAAGWLAPEHGKRTSVTVVPTELRSALQEAFSDALQGDAGAISVAQSGIRRKT